MQQTSVRKGKTGRSNNLNLNSCLRMCPMWTPPNRILPRTENYVDAICYENGGVTNCKIKNCLLLTGLCKLSLNSNQMWKWRKKNFIMIFTEIAWENNQTPAQYIYLAHVWLEKLCFMYLFWQYTHKLHIQHSIALCQTQGLKSTQLLCRTNECHFVKE